MVQSLQMQKQLKRSVIKKMINNFLSSIVGCVLQTIPHSLVILHIHFVFGPLQQHNIGLKWQTENKVERAPLLCLHPGLISLILKQDAHGRELIFCVNKLQFPTRGCFAWHFFCWKLHMINNVVLHLLLRELMENEHGLGYCAFC